MPRPKLARPDYRLRLRGRIWTVTWTDPETGATRAVSTRAAEREAAAIWRDQWLAGQEQPPPPAEPLLSDIFDGYLAAKAGKIEDHARQRHAVQALKRHIGNLEPQMLRPETYLERRAAEGVGDGTIRREIGVARAALSWCRKQQPPWINRAPHFEAPPNPDPRDRWLTREEVARLAAGCRNAYLRLFVLLAYATAARGGAILELTWDRVDLGGRRIAYHRPGRRRTRKRRATVRLNNMILVALQAARQEAIDRIVERFARSGADIDEEAVGRELARTHVIERHGKGIRSIKKGFAAAAARAGIEDCSPHVLRHTAATHMVIDGVRLAEVARMLGDSEAIVERVYGKHSPDYLKRAADALNLDFGPRLVSETLLEK